LIVEFRGVEKSYGYVKALRGATFEVPRGVLAGLLGPNGSGKTTSLKLSIGLLKRDKGDIKVFGLDPWVSGAEVRSRVGVLHERPLYPLDVRVRKLLSHLARLRRYGDEEAYRVARLVGLKDYLNASVGSLSRGYLQRLGIAQSLIGEPELLLLDEPTANLDPSARMGVLKLIATLKRDLGVTVVVSSHIIPELQEICDYAIFISEGVVAAYGYLSDLARLFETTSIYVVETPKPRELASTLIREGCVVGVEVGDGSLKVKVPGGELETFEGLISSMEREGLVLSYKHVSSSLGDLYVKAVKSF